MYFILASISLVIIILIIISFSINKKENIGVIPIQPSQHELLQNKPLQDKYIILSELNIKDKKYYRLGTKKNQFVDTLLIEKEIDSIIESIKSDEIKNNLKSERPLYIIGDRPGSFSEYDVFKNANTSMDDRLISDLPAFGTNAPYPGFLSVDFSNCSTLSKYESITFHEFMHTVEISGMTQQQKSRLILLYNKYNVRTPKYNIDSYAFSTVHEFFAEMAQIYCKMTKRLDVTGGITIDILQQELPEMFSFLEEIFYNHKSIETFCQFCNYHNLCI